MVDVFLSQHLDCPLGSTGKLLFNIDVGIIPCDVLILNVNIPPCQAENFAHPHGAGKRQIHGHIELSVVAVVQRLPDRFRIPYIPLGILGPGKNRVVKGIPADQLPANSLLKGAAQQLDDLFNRLVRHKGIFGLPGLG